MLAGKRGGKSYAGGAWFVREIQTNHDLGKHGDYLIVAPNNKKLRDAALPAFELFVPRVWIVPSKERGLFREKNSEYVLACGCKVLVRSADDPNALESMTILAAWVDEMGVMPQKAWENLLARVLSTGGRILMTTTPYTTQFWLKTQIYDAAMWKNGEKLVGDDLDADIEVVKWRTSDSPFIPKDDIEKARKRMSPEAFELAFEAEFTKPYGLVYPEFDTETHVVPPHSIPAHSRFGGLDFGFGSRTAVIGVVEIPGKESKDLPEYIVFREFYKSKSALLEVANAAQSMGMQYALGDPRGAQEMSELGRAYGVRNLQKADNSVEVGIERIRALFREGRLKIFSCCPNLIRELQSYSRNDDGDPVKKDDHAVDALRYAFSKDRSGFYQSWQTTSARRNNFKADNPHSRDQQISSITGY